MAHSGMWMPQGRCIMFLHVQDPGGGDLATKYSQPTHPHTLTELCEEGALLYASALSAGRIARAEAEATPCLLEFALLHPDPDDANWLRPVPPPSHSPSVSTRSNGRSSTDDGSPSN